MKLLKISPAQAGKIMGESAQFIRCGLKAGILPFGTAIKYDDVSKRYKYYINPCQLFLYLGRDDLVVEWKRQVKDAYSKKLKLERR